MDRRIEAFVLDFEGDLYGERISLEFVHRLRGMIKYDSLDPLVAQIQADVDETRRILTV